MIFITGDIHGEIDIKKLNTKNFPIQKELTKQDYVIICGDFGLIWNGSKAEKYWLDWLSDKPFTTLFVDGNHENFDLLQVFAATEWHGGKVQVIRPNILHLMRGQVYDIDGKKFFSMGGAASHDKKYRTEGKSWWAQEMPSAEEYKEAEINLAQHNWEVDCVITHCAPTSVQSYLNPSLVSDDLTAFFEQLIGRLKWDKWYFGHYHMDVPYGQYRAMYDDIVMI